MHINKKIGLLAFTLLFISSASFSANLGDACSNANQVVRERGVGANTGIVCDGSNYVAFKSYDTAPLRNGIGTTAPEATLHIDGEVIIGNTSLACSATTAGAMRYNSVDKNIEICDGTIWGAIKASACDNAPAFFHFDDQTNLATSTLATSNIVLITGMDGGCSTTISVSGTGGSPEYRTCSDSSCTTTVQTWTTANNTLDVQGDYMQLRATSSASLATGFTITVNVGGMTSNWVISTGMTGCSPEGTVCSDGTVYAGLSGASTPMYVTRCDAGMTWDGSNCAGTRLTRCWNNCNNTGGVSTGVISNSDGQTNTATIITIDSDSAITGIQPHQSAQYCADLIIHGYSDWYLPAKNELATIYNNRAAIANFNTSSYQSSSDMSASNAYKLNFANGVWHTYYNKTYNSYIRCARR